MANLIPAGKYAEMQGLSYKQVLRLAKIKGFPAIRIGGKKIYILKEQAAEWFRQKAKEPLS